MLCITRKPGETLVIDGKTVVTVVSLGPGQVRLGIEAPESVVVDRGEVHLQKSGRPTNRADGGEQRALRADALEGSAA